MPFTIVSNLDNEDGVDSPNEAYLINTKSAPIFYEMRGSFNGSIDSDSLLRQCQGGIDQIEFFSNVMGYLERRIAQEMRSDTTYISNQKQQMVGDGSTNADVDRKVD